MFGSGLQVDVIISCSGPDNNLQIFGGVKHLGIDFVGANYQSSHIGHCIEKLLLVGIFLKKNQLMTFSIENLTYALDSYRGKRLLGSNKYLHILTV